MHGGKPYMVSQVCSRPCCTRRIGLLWGGVRCMRQVEAVCLWGTSCPERNGKASHSKLAA